MKGEMKLRGKLESIRRLRRRQYHPLIHAVHKHHEISRRTLFYVKEYGPHSNVPKVIIKESIGILAMASILSSLGGLAMESVKPLLVAIIPLIILLPAMNDMIGDYGTIISSRFSTMLHEGKIRGPWWKNKELRKLLAQTLVVAAVTAVAAALMALGVAGMSSGFSSTTLALKILAVAVIDVLIMVSLLFIVAIVSGLHFFRKREDPSNFLIPITTSVADFTNMIILAVLLVVLF